MRLLTKCVTLEVASLNIRVNTVHLSVTHIADAILFLASDKAASTAGSAIVIDGGMTAS